MKKLKKEEIKKNEIRKSKIKRIENIHLIIDDLVCLCG